MNALLLPALRRVITDGALASLLSGLALVRSSRTDQAHRVGPGGERPEWRVGKPGFSSRAGAIALHTASSVVWGALYDRLRALRRRRTRLSRANACTDALLLTAVAAGLDRVLAPRALTPGADRAPTVTSLWMVYGGFAAGLALGGVLALRQERPDADAVDGGEA